jgi:dTDP-3-amino-3,4,6-trideoxy-alpha-D-glucose transaminase
MPFRIPLYDTIADNRPVLTELRAAFDRVVQSGRFALGPELAAFESEFARYLGAGHVVGVKSGTDAIVLALKAMGVGPGDEVVTTAFTYFASAEAILQAGATPVFADIDMDTLCLSPKACEDAMRPATRAILLVHLYGHCTDIDAFTAMAARHHVALIEDAAQAAGSTWRTRRLGTLGTAATFSFYPTKNLAALGEGGAVTTADPAIADRLRSLRSHGRDVTGRFAAVGWNSHLDELQAAFLRVKLARLDAENARRQQLAARYDAELPPAARPVRGATGCTANYHQYGILTSRRRSLRPFLAEAGIETACYYDTPVHLEPVFSRTAIRLAATEAACHDVLNLPIRPTLTDDEQTIVIEAVRRFFGA